MFVTLRGIIMNGNDNEDTDDDSANNAYCFTLTSSSLGESNSLFLDSECTPDETSTSVSRSSRSLLDLPRDVVVMILSLLLTDIYPIVPRITVKDRLQCKVTRSFMSIFGRHGINIGGCRHCAASYTLSSVMTVCKTFNLLCKDILQTIDRRRRRQQQQWSCTNK